MLSPAWLVLGYAISMAATSHSYVNHSVFPPTVERDNLSHNAVGADIMTHDIGPDGRSKGRLVFGSF